MSNIFLQKDNITILWDVYDYPIHKETAITPMFQKCLLLQIIITINWKQKNFQTNYDLEKVWENLQLMSYNYNSWNNLRDFLLAVWYEIDFSITEKIQLSEQNIK
jgi:hypothetical protein